MKTIQELRARQNQEVENGFANGNLWNDLEDQIYFMQNPQASLESEQGDLYAGKLIKR